MDRKIILSEIRLKGIRSSGAGGQHVNKVATKIELSFHLKKSAGLSESEKTWLIDKLSHKLTKEGILLLQCSENRSQLANKKTIIKRFLELLYQHLKKPRIRKTTKPSKKSIAKRLDNKQQQSLKKESRKKIRY